MSSAASGADRLPGARAELPAARAAAAAAKPGVASCRLVLNMGSSGWHTAARCRRLNRALEALGTGFDTVVASGRADAVRLAAEAALCCDMVVAVGGDGTVSDVATGILRAARPGVALGILPMGTGNEVALALGLGRLETAVAALQGGRHRVIDACEVRFGEDAPGPSPGRVSVHWCGVGFPAEVVSRANPRLKRSLGSIAYVSAAAGAAFGYRWPWMQVRIDRGPVREGILLCGVANFERAAGQRLQVAPGALPDDGHLEVLLARRVGLGRVLASLLRMTFRRPPTMDSVETLAAGEVEVGGSRPVPVMVDGDVMGRTPATFRILPGALRVRVPGSPD